MIESLQLINYQAHKNSLLEFSPGINCIIGASDKGKSTIMRSLQALVNNELFGLEMASDWITKHHKTKDKTTKKEKDVIEIRSGHEMRIILKNKTHVVERYRNEQNGYMVDDEKMEAIRTDVPQQVSKALNIGEVNIQKQMDAPFLISCSGGETARFINKMVNLEEIDTFLSEMSICVNQANKDLENEKALIKEHEDSLKEFSWIDLLAPIVAQIEKHDATVMGLEQQIGQLQFDVGSHAISSSVIVKADALISSASEIVSKLKKLDSQTAKVAAQFNAISLTIEEYAAAQAKLKLSENLELLVEFLAKIKAIDLELKDFPSADALEAVIAQYKTNVLILQMDDAQAIQCVTKIKSLDGRIDFVLEQDRSLSSSIFSYIKEKANIERLDIELKELQASRPEVCPTCGRSKDHKHDGE